MAVLSSPPSRRGCRCPLQLQVERSAAGCEGARPSVRSGGGGRGDYGESRGAASSRKNRSSSNLGGGGRRDVEDDTGHKKCRERGPNRKRCRQPGKRQQTRGEGQKAASPGQRTQRLQHAAAEAPNCQRGPGSRSCCRRKDLWCRSAQEFCKEKCWT